MSNRPTKDERYLNVSLENAKGTTCLKRGYSCVIVRDDVIVSTGYNGSPRGEENCCDRGTCKRPEATRYSGYNECDSVHAEMNAITQADGAKLIDATVYLACYDVQNKTEDLNPKPCPICMRMLRNARVSKIINRTGIVWKKENTNEPCR